MRHRHIPSKVVPFALCALLAGCAGLPQTQDQIVTIETSPNTPSTHCLIENSRGAWTVSDTPQRVSIQRDSKPLLITCRSPLGYHGSITLAAHWNFETPFLGSGSQKVAEMSDATPPDYAYQANNTNEWNGTFRIYPGTIIVTMTPDDQ